MFTSAITLMPIYSDGNEFFIKCRETWNKITELVGIDDPTNFVETNLDDNENEFIMLEIEKNKYKCY